MNENKLALNNMRIKSDTKLVDLISVAKLYKKDIFKTNEGDVLNLKSLVSVLLLQS